STSELALDASGKFLALRFSYIADLGAYLAPTGPFINTQGVVACLTGVYAVPAACARVKLAVTNKAPGAAYRGAGRPVMSYMLERLVDEAAVELGVDPAELRRKNLVTQDKFPYKAANGIIYDCGDFVGVLGDALKASDWAGFPARRAEAAARGKLRGRGMAAYIEASGGGFAPSDQVELRFDPDGGVTMYAVSHSHGQAHEATAQKYAGTASGLDVKTEGKFGVTFPNGCHVAEVEIEPETGIAEIVRFTAVDDAGNIVNHQIVEGQMQGGITQGAGQVFGEHAVYDPDTGQLLSGSFM